MIGFFTNIFGGVSWKALLNFILIIVVVGAIGGTIYTVNKTISDLRTENASLLIDNATLTANNASLTQALADQQTTIEALQRDFQIQSEILNNTNQEFQDARDQVTRLRDRLSDHELGFLAANRPGLVERIVNNATDDIGRCFEIAAGSPLTVDEINATLKSQINSECPQLANPNYKE